MTDGDFEAGARPKLRGRPKSPHTLAAEAAGLSGHQVKTALRVASIPKAEFEWLVESDQPSTVTDLAEIGLAYRSPRGPQQTSPHANLAAVFNGVTESERASRVRELRIAAMLQLGPNHPVTRAAAAAIRDPDAIGALLAELDELAALPRRRLLATMASVLPA